jgi:hypothetical protein
MDDMEKWKFLTQPWLELRILGHPACSQLLYQATTALSISAIYKFPLIYLKSHYEETMGLWMLSIVQNVNNYKRVSKMDMFPFSGEGDIFCP